MGGSCRTDAQKRLCCGIAGYETPRERSPPECGELMGEVKGDFSGVWLGDARGARESNGPPIERRWSPRLSRACASTFSWDDIVGLSVTIIGSPPTDLLASGRWICPPDGYCRPENRRGSADARSLLLSGCPCSRLVRPGTPGWDLRPDPLLPVPRANRSALAPGESRTGVGADDSAASSRPAFIATRASLTVASPANDRRMLVGRSSQRPGRRRPQRASSGGVRGVIKGEVDRRRQLWR
ncbi:hypothetical protein T484DRAFT_2588630 [Baffinella frigidus]|nr:hypothetical protein T484DRAFT_2588630 [Cryptophyta sp. CCMP2293]|mmetsp:Transcript_25128/g.59929  ORF Transcript_25128/g.59929 Transcript_25128/m.59929 type:complete len:240 (-) Transcript_25128:63-782(-)